MGAASSSSIMPVARKGRLATEAACSTSARQVTIVEDISVQLI